MRGSGRCLVRAAWDDHHGAARLAAYFLGDRPEQEPLEPRPTMAPDHNQIRPDDVRLSEDLETRPSSMTTGSIWTPAVESRSTKCRNWSTSALTIDRVEGERLRPVSAK
jgi:hypothetical protein